MAVGADEGLAGDAEALQVDLVADAVAGAGEVQAVLLCHGLDVPVVVGVLKAGLQGVVVDVGHAALRPHPGDAHGLKLQVGHGARGVLGQRLVDAQGYLAAGGHVPADQMRSDDFLSNGQAAHFVFPPIILFMACWRCSSVSRAAASPSWAAMAS